MKNIKKLFVVSALMAGTLVSWGDKKVLGHDDFDRWEKVTNNAVSNNGLWAAFAINPQEGDGTLYLKNTAKGSVIEIKRGYRPSFTADGQWAVALIKPEYQKTRKAKIAKKKDLELPQDSLAIVNLATGKVEKMAGVLSYLTPEKGGSYVAWQTCDTAYIKPKQLKDRKIGRPLLVKNLTSGKMRVIKRVKDYLFSKDGSKLAVTLTKMKGDSLATTGVGVLNTKEDSLQMIDKCKPFYGRPVFNENATSLAFVASQDSVETGTRAGMLFLTDLSSGTYSPKQIRVDVSKDMKLNQYSIPMFSHNGKRLVIGIAPVVAPDDTTLVSFERPTLDIWRWDAPYTPPQEKTMADRLKRKTYPVVIDLATDRQILVTSAPQARVTTPNRWDSDWALIEDATETGIGAQWDYQHPVKLYLKNIVNGETKEIGIVPNRMSELSPNDRFVAWFDDRAYHVYDIAEGVTRVVGEDAGVLFWDEDTDRPVHVSEPCGAMGWTANDDRMLVYDRYDVWSLDPKGVAAPVCITAGEGRKRGLTIRYVRTDPERRFISQGDKVLYSLFDHATKQNGLASQTFTGKALAPKIDFLGEFTINQILKAKDADVYSWCQGNFSTSPNIYISRGLLAAKTEKVSDSNPQMAEYNWGTAQLFKWHAYDGKPSEGCLYLPENFDPNKEYPMLVYFYEIYSNSLFKHYDMEPSWSWINFPFYVSRGYVIFVPDIHYTAGIPGENAYNYVCSGVDAVCKAFPNIDKKRIGIDGQSWGGYQTAFLVTRTNMFACAGSGAPVANMTSAFGGIRWGSGDSRQAQYEVGQSRIGRNLWEAPELYIANSPVFHADRVNTPLLIMHNDNDGAVPWYQGIEMFMALRRLGKPVWMLEYNGEEHNLKERRNRKDITRRLQQFFDHYLKGDPMPEWMKNGVPIIRKGQELGY